MQTLRRHPLAKAVAIFLLALSMFAAVILGITTVVFYSVGIYHTNDTIAQDALRSLQTTVLEIEARETGDQIMYQMDAFIQDPEITGRTVKPSPRTRRWAPISAGKCP